MPGITNISGEKKKRKRDNAPPEPKESKKHIIDAGASPKRDYQSEILLLESKILESRKNYNGISTLLEYLRGEYAGLEQDVVAPVALCRIFCKLMATGSLSKTNNSSDNESTIVQWLKERLQDYRSALLTWLGLQDPVKQITAITLLMRVMKEEAKHLHVSEHATWSSGFQDMISSLVEIDAASGARVEFIEKYVEEFDDIRYYTFARLAYVSSSLPGRGEDANISQRRPSGWKPGDQGTERN